MCGRRGTLVKSQTVKSLAISDIDEDLRLEIFSLCMDPRCEMAYYSADYGHLYLQRNLKKPLDFKELSEVRYACYCHEITIDQLRHMVLKENARTIKDIFFKKPIIVDQCIKNNPFGCSCMPDVMKMVEEILQGKSGEL